MVSDVKRESLGTWNVDMESKACEDDGNGQGAPGGQRSLVLEPLLDLNDLAMLTRVVDRLAFFLLCLKRERQQGQSPPLFPQASSYILPH